MDIEKHQQQTGSGFAGVRGYAKPELEPSAARITPGGVGVGGIPSDEGWHVAHFPKTGWTEIVFVRLDMEKQEYVVDVIGQEKRHSEDLWRYKEWVFSKRLLLEGWGGVSLNGDAQSGAASHNGALSNGGKA